MGQAIKLTEDWILTFEISGDSFTFDGDQLLRVISREDNHPATETRPNEDGFEALCYTEEYCGRMAAAMAAIAKEGSGVITGSRATKIRQGALEADAELKKNRATSVTPAASTDSMSERSPTPNDAAV